MRKLAKPLHRNGCVGNIAHKRKKRGEAYLLDVGIKEIMHMSRCPKACYPLNPMFNYDSSILNY